MEQELFIRAGEVSSVRAYMEANNISVKELGETYPTSNSFWTKAIIDVRADEGYKALEALFHADNIRNFYRQERICPHLTLTHYTGR